MKSQFTKWLTLPVVAMSLFIAACSDSPSITFPALSNSAMKTPGSVVWRDLATTAPDQVKPFYENVFGWKFETISDNYSLIQYQGHYIAGMATLPTTSSTNYWLPVISTDNVDNTLAQAKNAGGTILIKKTTLKGRGDMAVIQDPQGAVFSILNTINGDPDALEKQSGNWMWQEVWTQDINQSQSFYQKLGHYKAETKSLNKHDYPFLSINNKPAFGFVKKPNADVATTWVNYIRVDDVNATVKKITQNGGYILMAPTKLVHNGTVAIVRDPAGAGFVVQESLK